VIQPNGQIPQGSTVGVPPRTENIGNSPVFSVL
jgi:hypothetical protein